MTKIIIVRHGESLGNARNIFLGHTNMDLTELGKAQAEKTAEYLRDYNIDAIYSSDLDRAYNTALPTAKIHNKQIIKTQKLREIFAGSWEEQEYFKIDSTAFKTWINDIDNAACECGESVAEMKNRIVGAVDDIAAKNNGKTIAIFTHATPVRAMFSAWKNVPMNVVDWVKNASVTIVEYNGINDVTFIKTDYAEHLDDMITFLPSSVEK